MSIKRMTAVWEDSQHKGSDLLLLLALADNADDRGYCWPGIDYLADKIRMTKQSVINISERLEESGELYIEHNRRHGNRYLVTVGLKDDEIGETLRIKFGYTPDDVEAISTNILRKAGFTSEVKPGFTSEVKQALQEPSTNRQSTVNDGAGAPNQSGEVSEETNDDALFWGDRPRPEPSAGPTFTARDLQTEEGRIRAQEILIQSRSGVLDNRPWLYLERESETIRKYAPGVAVDRDAVLRFVAYMIDHHVPLDLQKPGSVRFWLKETESLLRMAEGEVRVLEQALQKAFRDGMSVKSPKSVEYAISDVLRGVDQVSKGLGEISGSEGGVRTRIRTIQVPESARTD